jgi:hypothetical protein
MKKWPMFALLVLGTLLGATVLSGPIATAAQSVSATITGPLDGQGNVKVHEQGTANVNVTNGSLNVASPTPITDGGSDLVQVGGVAHLDTTYTASALSIHMDDDVGTMAFFLFGDNPSPQRPAAFLGPANGGNASINLALDRPITFDAIGCGANGTGLCSTSWVGASP